MKAFPRLLVFLLIFLNCINNTVIAAPSKSLLGIRDQFFKLDRDRNGRITKLEIKAINRKAVEETLLGFDLNNDGNIHFSEYYINKRHGEALYDYRDGDGWINVSSVLRFLYILMQDLDTNLDHKITYEELFKNILR